MTSKEVYGQKKVREIEITSRSFPCDCIILSRDPEPEVSGQRNIIWRFLVADETGSMVMKIWGDQGELLMEGDIVHLHDAEVRQFLGFPYMTLSRSGHIQRIGRDIFLYNDKPNRSEELRDANAQSTPGNILYSQQQRANPTARPGNGKQAAINPAFKQGNTQPAKSPPSTSAPFKSYQSKQIQQSSSPAAPSTTAEPTRGGFNRNGRGDRGKRVRSRRGFRDRDQPERASPVPVLDRSHDFADADGSITPMKREFEDQNQGSRQRSRINYDKA